MAIIKIQFIIYTGLLMPGVCMVVSADEQSESVVEIYLYQKSKRNLKVSIC